MSWLGMVRKRIGGGSQVGFFLKIVLGNWGRGASLENEGRGTEKLLSICSSV